MTESNHGTEPRGTETTRVHRVAAATIPTDHGEFTAYAYRSISTGDEHLAYVMGEVQGAEPVLVRLHSECLTGDTLGSMRCDCGEQLDLALRAIADAGSGVLVYLRGHEGRGIGLANKISAYALQEFDGLDTVDANTAQGLPIDARDYGVGAEILEDLGLRAVRMMTNNPAKIEALEAHGLVVVEKISLPTTRNEHNHRYLETKRDRLGHDLR